ncbi:hypothetical protein [Nocardia gamkensis]|uniref:hypothetical protein n=1 Tax=Nocardia gamkensis TaxID=352869 RepID=UPI00378F8604
MVELVGGGDPLVIELDAESRGRGQGEHAVGDAVGVVGAALAVLRVDGAITRD